MAWTSDTSRVAAGVRAAINAIVDDQIRALVGAWARGFDEVSIDLNDAILDLTRTVGAGGRISASQLIRFNKLHQALELMANQLDELATSAGVLITGDLLELVRIAGQAQAQLLGTQLPSESPASLIHGWDSINPLEIDAIIRRSTEQITARTRPISADAMSVVRRELVRGVTVGANPRATTARIVARAGSGFNGGLTRALTISRTESLDASRAAAQLGRVANSDILTGWIWHCELSPRSCPACVSMDGEVFSVDEPGPDDHANGRCTAIPVTKSWADLGFSGLDEPDSTRQSGSDWFDQQSPSVQVGILGPSKYDAWKNGDYPMTAWGRMQHNDGWRDSLQQTRSPYGSVPVGQRNPARVA